MSRELPLASVPNYDQYDPEIDKISWDFSLPSSLDQERVVLNTTQLNRLQKIGAFRSSHFFEYRGGVSQYDTSIAGINRDGSGVAGKSLLVEESDLSESNLRDDATGLLGKALMRDHFRTSTIHKLNKDEIASRVVDYKQEKNISREEAWAKLLNMAVRQSMNESAYRHLVKRAHISKQTLDATVIGMNAGVIINNTLEHDPVAVGTTAGILGMCYALTVAGAAIINKTFEGETYFSERRWSLMPFGGWQPDRYLAFSGLSKVSPLIRYRS